MESGVYQPRIRIPGTSLLLDREGLHGIEVRNKINQINRVGHQNRIVAKSWEWKSIDPFKVRNGTLKGTRVQDSRGVARGRLSERRDDLETVAAEV